MEEVVPKMGLKALRQGFQAEGRKPSCGERGGWSVEEMLGGGVGPPVCWGPH